MDIALKQRLVGAVVLVALGVVFIPMLLDGPTDRQDRPVNVQIPEMPEGRYETRRLALDPAQAPREESPEPRLVRTPGPSPGSDVPEVVVARPETKPRAPSPAPLETSPVTAEPARPGASTGVQEEADGASPAEESTAAVAPARAPALSGEWVIQLGSFSQQANAERLVTRAREEGFEAWSEPIPVGDSIVHRVRAGAWSERDEAMVVAARLVELMALGDGVSLRRIDADAAEAEPVDPGFGWWVQAGVFARQGNAEGLRDRLRAAGFVARAEGIRVGGEPRYRVRVGPQLDRAEAEAALQRLDREFGIKGIVVSNP